MRRRLAVRGGFTLLEALVALVLLSGIIAIAMTLFTVQLRAFAVGADGAELGISAEFAGGMLRRELRTAGTNVTARQPALVYGGGDVVAFNADVVSRVPDPFAVYVDPDAEAGAVSAMPSAQRHTLPGTAFTFPDSTYWAAPNVLAPAELVLFRFEPDTSTARGDDFILVRRVNAAAPEVLLRNVLRTGTQPFFQYMRPVRAADGTTTLQAIPAGSIPVAHRAPLHLTPGDTGIFSLVDSVRAVRFSFTVTNARAGDAERRLSRSDVVWLRNAGLATARTCGGPPLFATVVNTALISVSGAPAVRIRWNPSADEPGGERDVIRYVVWRYSGATLTGDPFLSIPAGSASYEYIDSSVQPGESWRYAVAAQDCTPSLSAPVSSGVVNVP